MTIALSLTSIYQQLITCFFNCNFLLCRHYIESSSTKKRDKLFSGIFGSIIASNWNQLKKKSKQMRTLCPHRRAWTVYLNGKTHSGRELSYESHAKHAGGIRVGQSLQQ